MDLVRFEDSVFYTGENKVVEEKFHYVIMEDKWPVCEGHLLFIPKKNDPLCIGITIEDVVEYGNKLREEGKIDAYHFGMNMGEAAGQTVMWPHVHFIPRHVGDVEGFPGSVRLAHRNGRGAKYYLEHSEFKDDYREKHKHILHEKGLE